MLLYHHYCSPLPPYILADEFKQLLIALLAAEWRVEEELRVYITYCGKLKREGGRVSPYNRQPEVENWSESIKNISSYESIFEICEDIS